MPPAPASRSAVGRIGPYARVGDLFLGPRAAFLVLMLDPTLRSSLTYACFKGGVLPTMEGCVNVRELFCARCVFSDDRGFAMADKQGAIVLIQTWAQAASNTAGHQRDYLIEAIRMKRSASDHRGEPKKSAAVKGKSPRATAD
jgi:hypothetical protein